MARTQYNLRHASRAERRDYREGVRRDFDKFAAEDAELLGTGEFLGGTYRPSDSTPKVPEADLRALDDLLERFGLVRVLRSLRELADGRAPSGEFGDSFEVEEDRDHWKEKADALETLLGAMQK